MKAGFHKIRGITKRVNADIIRGALHHEYRVKSFIVYEGYNPTVVCDITLQDKSAVIKTARALRYSLEHYYDCIEEAKESQAAANIMSDYRTLTGEIPE